MSLIFYSLLFFKMNSNPCKMDTVGTTEIARFNGVSVLSGYLLEEMYGRLAGIKTTVRDRAVLI